MLLIIGSFDVLIMMVGNVGYGEILIEFFNIVLMIFGSVVNFSLINIMIFNVGNFVFMVDCNNV